MEWLPFFQWAVDAYNQAPEPVTQAVAVAPVAPIVHTVDLSGVTEQLTSIRNELSVMGEQIGFRLMSLESLVSVLIWLSVANLINGVLLWFKPAPRSKEEFKTHKPLLRRSQFGVNPGNPELEPL